MHTENSRQNVIMMGPDLDVRGGISFVVREYLQAGLDKKVNLFFIPSHKDGTILRKILVFLKAFCIFIFCLVQIRNPIIHLHVSKRGSFFRKFSFFLIAKVFHKRTIVHLHSSEFEEFRRGGKIVSFLVKFMFDKTDRVIVLTEGWKNIVQRFSSNKNVIILYNPVALKERIQRNSNEVLILFLGRLCKEKGSYDLLHCIMLNKKYFIQNNVRFILAGDGDVENIQRIVREKGLEEVATVHDWISGDQKEMYLKDSDILILPSYSEQMPMSILEGMAFGLPVISTTVGGIPQMVEHGENGFLFGPGDIEAMTDALKQLYDNKGLREKMGNRSRGIVMKKFDSKIIVEKLINVYKELQFS